MYAKKTTAVILAVLIILSIIPVGVSAAENPLTLTLTAEDGTPITGATVTASAKTIFGGTAYTLTVEESGNGEYVIDRGSYNNFFYTITINVTADGYVSSSTTASGSSSTAELQLTAEETGEPDATDPTETEPEVTETEPEATETEPEATENTNADWQEFELFYYLNGSETDPFPDNYAAEGNAGNYGPSGDNTPFVTLNVDMNALKNQYSDIVVYEENTDENNDFQFTPVDSTDKMAASKAFWEAVLVCIDDASREALEATGISQWFVGYVAKLDRYGAYHIDGILEVTPPVYSIELYKDTEYVGGLLTNQDEDFKTMSDVLMALEGYLGYTITWEEDETGNPVAKTDSSGNTYYEGTFIENRNLHTITVSQTNAAQAEAVDGSEIDYEKKSDYYYVAYFNLEIQEGHQVEFTVSYTDGDANDAAFYEHSYGVTKSGNVDPTVPAFTGVTLYEGHDFLGWVLEGGDGTVLSDMEVQAMTVTQDMVFHAQWKKLFIVVFHTNNENALDSDIFRTYYASGSEVPEGGYAMTEEDAVESFYDIPTFAYNVHNGYIFKGWYMGTEEAAEPMDWNTSYAEETHIYAHWISVGEVAKENDGKIYESEAYPEYDLLGNQIRIATDNPNLHYGEAAPGLRFVASLSERVYQEMNAIHTENSDGIEYGFIIAAATAAAAKADGDGYMLKYKHATINGEDTTSTYSYVNNIPCRVPDEPVDDHYSGEQYRLYTAAITYKNLEGDRLTQAQNTYFIGRAYLRYFDANGLERVHYNNYTGDSQTYGGVNTCYTEVNEMVNGL